MKEPIEQMRLTVSCDPTRINRRLMRILKNFIIDELNRNGQGKVCIKCESVCIEELHTNE